MTDRARAPLDEAEIGLLRSALQTTNEIRILADSQVSRNTLWRALAGLDLNRGSRVMLRQYLDVFRMKESA